MKKNILICLSIFVNCVLFTYYLHQYKTRKPIIVMSGNPGSRIKVVDWPEEFDSVLQETGQINSPMHFEQKADTLMVGFSHD